MNKDRWKQIDELFDAILDLPEAKHEEYLSAHCEGDDELKNEVLSLLKADTSSENFLEQSAMGIAAKNLADEQTIANETFLPGRTLGTYIIEKQIGEGGMGEVYLATDEKLKRSVALKILPTEYTFNDERVKRFEIEARAISALNHPNIVTIYDVGNIDGINFIATEFVEGKTLRELIGSNLKLKDVLDIILQACDALSVAHDSHIIHRDIKPENIMIRPDGYVKILDFGLAKLSEIDQNSMEISMHTVKGIIIGTPVYMSPEQVSGENIDHRTDLWSIGVILYELITGTNPFKKNNRKETFQMILAEDPPLASSMNEKVSAELDQILAKALEKDADLSYQTASDLRADLMRIKREIDSSPSLRSGSLIREGKAKRKRRFFYAAGLLIFISIFLTLWFFIGLFQQNLAPPDWTQAKNVRLSDRAGTEFYPSLSPNGKNYVYAAGTKGNLDIFSQRIGGKNPVNLTESSLADDTQSTFSPDGEFIAFRSERELSGIYIMGASGENPRRVSDFGFHPSWSPDGKEITVSTIMQDVPALKGRSAIWVINIESGEKRMLIDNFAMQPSWSPNGKYIAYWFTETGGKRHIATISPNGGEPNVITDSGNTNWNPVWSAKDKFLYFASDRNGSMAFWRVRIDPQTGKKLGEAEVVPTPANFNRHLSFSQDGKKMIYVQTRNQSNLKSVSFDMKNEKIGTDIKSLTSGNGEITHVELSPDRTTFVARQISPTKEDIILLNRDGTIQRELTDDKFFDRYPRWSPDGSKIVFVSDRSGKYEIWTINADGTNLNQITDVKDKTNSIPAWSPDGTRISFDNSYNTFILDLSKEWSEKKLLEISIPFGSSHFRIWDWSPDGRKLVGILKQGKGYGTVIYDFETEKFVKLKDITNFTFWLPDSRRIIYTNGAKVFIIETKSNKTREIEFPNSDNIRQARISNDGKLLYFSVFNTESDIWLLDNSPSN